MAYQMILGDEGAFQTALRLLESYKKTNKVRSPTLMLLLALLYYRKGAGHAPEVPTIEDTEKPIKRKNLELAVDDLFTKTDPPDPDRPVLMLLTGSWLKDSRHPEQNTWRNPMDTQAGLGCVAPEQDLRIIEYAVAERSSCPHREEASRKCKLSGSACHNPTKKGGFGPTKVPSLPKALKPYERGFKIITLHPSALAMALGKGAEKIPIFPFLYALYHRSRLFGEPQTADLDRFTSDFFLDDSATSALFDTDPSSALNRQLLLCCITKH
ncbi:hypothetical protein ES703_33057 [subsurface metagenome]